MRIGPRLLQRIYGPHGQIIYQQKCDRFAARFPTNLLLGDAGTTRCIEDEQGLAGRLYQRRGCCQQYQYGVLFFGKMTPYDGERTIYEDASLRAHQQNVVELEVATTVELQLTHLIGENRNFLE